MVGELVPVARRPPAFVGRAGKRPRAGRLRVAGGRISQAQPLAYGKTLIHKGLCVKQKNTPTGRAAARGRAARGLNWRSAT